MPLLLLIGFTAGLVTGISPCILPVLPIVLVAGATGADATGADVADPSAGPSSRWRRRPYAVIAGLIASFSAVTLVGSWLLGSLGLPQDLLRDAGLVLLALVALGLLIDPLGPLLERPFARLGRFQPRSDLGGFVLGLALGVVFVPCAGPVLATISVVGSTHRVALGSVLLTVCFATGAALPMLGVAVAGRELTSRGVHRDCTMRRLRRGAGVVLLATTAALWLNLAAGLQRSVPGYTSALQQGIENNTFARQQLQQLRGITGTAALADCMDGDPNLERCGPAPAFRQLSTWFNTPGQRPLTLAGLRGRVVLIDFWTYSCINCQRTLPHLEAWDARYRSAGLTIVGIHTPEFAFEHVAGNVHQAVADLQVRYPVAIDDSYGTWTAYDNQYWPAEYLVDATGEVRHVDFGEGGYQATETLIRRLLLDAAPHRALPPPTSVPDTTPTTPALTPESYLGTDRLQNNAGQPVTSSAPTRYALPAAVPLDGLAFGGVWSVDGERALAGSGATLVLVYDARDVYLVLGGTGTVSVSVDGRPSTPVAVRGIPRLYALVQGSTVTEATLTLTATPGVAAYDFTFG